MKLWFLTTTSNEPYLGLQETVAMLGSYQFIDGLFYENYFQYMYAGTTDKKQSSFWALKPKTRHFLPESSW